MISYPTHILHIVPIENASPIKGAPYGSRKAQIDIDYQYCPKILNNYSMFNRIPPLESSEPQHLGH